MRNHGAKVRKENLAIWISLALKKALTKSNIKARFRGSSMWPLNLEAMQGKMGPSKTFLSRSAAKVAQEEKDMAQIIEEGLPSPLSNPTHFYVENEDESDLVEELSQEEPPSYHNISTFFRLPQEIDTRNRVICEPLVDYTQSQILTSNVYLETLQNIAHKKEEITIEKERKRLEKELTKEKREAKRQKNREAQEKRAVEKEAKRLANTAEAMTAQEEAKKQFKANWTTKACEQVGQ